MKSFSFSTFYGIIMQMFWGDGHHRNQWLKVWKTENDMNHKLTEFFLLAVVAIVYATVCMETDIYVPAFPDMKLFFATNAESIQQILSVNFVGIFLGSLLFGPLSDTLGRRRSLLIGLVLFSVTSWSCCITTQLNWLLSARLFQGNCRKNRN